MNPIKALAIAFVFTSCSNSPGVDSPDAGVLADDVASCLSHRTGSCVDAEKCTNFDGTFFTSSNSEMYCSGTFNPGCACPEEEATGQCVVFAELANRTTEVYYEADVTEELQDCIKDRAFNEWHSTENTPDVTWACIRTTQSSRFGADGTVWRTCDLAWVCGPDAADFAVACEQDGDIESPYTCTCTDASGSTEFAADVSDAPCGLVGQSAEEQSATFAQMEALVETACGWMVGGTAP